MGDIIPMKKVLGYYRVSTANQLDGDGFDRQSATVKAFCETKGWGILRDFNEQQSGSVDSKERPKLLEAIELCGPSTTDIIVVERVDRIGRDLVVCELFFRECKKRGIRVFAADSGEELVNSEGDPTRKLIRQILGALAEWDKSQTVRKLQSGRRKKAKETGKPCGGPSRYIERPESEAVFALIEVSQDRGDSFKKTADRLNAKKLPTPNGKAFWTKGSVAHLYRTYVRSDLYSYPNTASIL
jgi:DNA invertase Pin-like site-specific DNA recombinase